MQPLFNDIEEIKKTVKINASFKFENLIPYLDDAYVRYIQPYVGEPLMAKLSQDPTDKAMELIRKALGPLAVAIASPELSIQLGDSGHTVQRTDKVTVASDAKIRMFEENMEERGWRNLDVLLELFSSNIETYPEWKESRYYKQLSSGHLFNSAREFQDSGKVDICYSMLTFEKLRPALERYELILRKRLSPTLFEKLLSEAESGTDKLLSELRQYSRLWLASSVAGVYSSQMTRKQRQSHGDIEFKPVFYPLFNDMTDTGNFYVDQAKYWDSMITEFMTVNAVDLGLAGGVTENFNSKDKHIFAT